MSLGCFWTEDAVAEGFPTQKLSATESETAVLIGAGYLLAFSNV